MIWNKKIKAGALQLVLFVGAVIAVMLLSFVLVSYSHNLFQKKSDVTIEVIKAADQALQQSFSIPMMDGEQKEIQLDNDLGIEATVAKSFWGLLELRKVVSIKGAFQFEKVAFLGNSEKERHALYLKDNKRPLVLAGNTKISGTAYLPEQGVKMGNIYGNSYYASQLIFGEERQSNSKLPKLSPEIKKQFDALTGINFYPQGEQLELIKGTEVKNSFKEPTKLVQGHSLVLEDITLKGNILIWANRRIEVRPSAKLHDVLLIAPEIKIANWTKGNFQAFASESILVGKGVEMNYPSVLAVKNINKDSLSQKNMEPNIHLDSYAQIRGKVFFEALGEPNTYKPHVKIDENAKVYGEVFSNQNIELKGSIFGSLTTSAFVALENGNIYQNHIYNGRIDANALSEEYVGLSFGHSKTNKVAKWGY